MSSLKGETAKIKKREEGEAEISQRVNLNVALKRRLGILPNLYNAGFLHILWEHAIHRRCIWEYAGKRSSKTFKGTAVRL